jgi:peptidoglycan hydrolase-like protein with peptidoglycan-binding domain
VANLAGEIIDVGSSRIGQKYILGANVPLNNPNWNGPWDCAEFASWCVFQAFGFIFGANTQTNLEKAEPFSGFWADEAIKSGRVIPWEQALKIEGAVLIRKPAPGKIGHVAFCLGDGRRTLEARGKDFGVGIFDGAANRAWSFGFLLPNVDYDIAIDDLPAAPPTVKAFPEGYLWWKKPPFKSAIVFSVQRALKAKGIDPGPIDGEFGANTHKAVATFQLQKGVEVDGVIGPTSAKKLGLAFPIIASAADEAGFATLSKPTGPATATVITPPAVAASAAGASVDTIASVNKVGKFYRATTTGGFSFIVGSETTFTDDMQRVGLFQGSSSIADSLQFGVYSAADFPGYGQWANFIEPTLNAEGGARFATLNSYDRAAFTFGAPQFAAHTPDENLVVYLRKLLTLPNAQAYFPDLLLQKNAGGKTTIHQSTAMGTKDLEQVVEVIRPNGKKERQIPGFMQYLNDDPKAVGKRELIAAARLMLWLKQDQQAAALQIEVFIDTIKAKLAEAKQKVPAFTGQNWEIALWIMDIRHQGRGSFLEIGSALNQSDPAAALRKIGFPKYKTRIDTVSAKIAALKATGVMNGFVV